ncbi:MAG: hypothetical protein ABR512_07775 [Desulfopila sp.]
MFNVTADLVEAIPVDDLEQLQDQGIRYPGLADEGEKEKLPEALSADESIGTKETSLPDDEVVAALSGYDDHSEAGKTVVDENDEDETLTIIEESPQKPFAAETEKRDYADEEEVMPKEPTAQEPTDLEEYAAATDGAGNQNVVLEQNDSGAGENVDNVLTFDDELAAIEEEEAAETSELDRVLSAIDDDGPAVASDGGDIASENLDGKDEESGDDAEPLDASFLEDSLDEYDDAADSEDWADDVADGADEETAYTHIRKCGACNEYVDPSSKYEHDGMVYCSRCKPAVLPLQEQEEKSGPDDDQQCRAPGEVAPEAVAAGAAAQLAEMTPGRFTVLTLLNDAWRYSKGVKSSLWGALIVMHLVLIVLGGAVALLAPPLFSGSVPLAAVAAEGALQVLLSFLSFLFTAGILMIAVNKIGQRYFNWKMVFVGFRRLGVLLQLFVLQSIMLVVGFVLFILPGIYLSVAYILAIPLIFLRGLGPWQALEISRQAVHKRWWTVFFAIIAMSVLMGISAIPAGLGLIWTVPMFVVMVGVLYYHFFGMVEEVENV